MPLLGEQPLDHHLRGDAGVVGAGLPERIAALHAPPADQRVLDGEGQRMTHVQAARDVRRRDHDGERRGARAPGRRRTPPPAPSPHRGGARPRAVSRSCSAWRLARAARLGAQAGGPRRPRGMSEYRRGRRRARSRPAPGARPEAAGWASSHCFSIGRISSRTMSSIVGPPRMHAASVRDQRANETADRGGGRGSRRRGDAGRRGSGPSLPEDRRPQTSRLGRS